VCGDAAVMFDPYDVGAIADGMRQALSSSEQLTSLGLQRARLFTWAVAAERHEWAYGSAAIR
jgi:hypothetical protein